MVDLIIEANEILTLDRLRPTAKRFGITNGRIIGFDEELDGFDLSSVPVDRYPNQTIVPGFIDAHCHTTWWGLGLNGIPVAEARGLDEFYDLLRDAVAKLDEGEWVYGIGFSEMHHGGQLPDIRVVDEITGDHPMYIRNISGHASLTNTATLRMVGAFDPDFEPPQGGVLVQDESGKFTGLVEETAQGLLQQLILPYSHDQIVAALHTATKEYAAQGITSFTEAGVGGGWIGHSPVEIAAYQTAAESGQLFARAQLMQPWMRWKILRAQPQTSRARSTLPDFHSASALASAANLFRSARSKCSPMGHCSAELLPSPSRSVGTPTTTATC